MFCFVDTKDLLVTAIQETEECIVYIESFSARIDEVEEGLVFYCTRNRYSTINNMKDNNIGTIGENINFCQALGKDLYVKKSVGE